MHTHSGLVMAESAAESVRVWFALRHAVWYAMQLAMVQWRAISQGMLVN